MIAVKNGVPVYIDVKAKNTDKDWGHSRTEERKKLRVQVVEFNGNTRKSRWVEHQE
jgi:hypothetical protein